MLSKRISANIRSAQIVQKRIQHRRTNWKKRVGRWHLAGNVEWPGVIAWLMRATLKVRWQKSITHNVANCQSLIRRTLGKCIPPPWPNCGKKLLICRGNDCLYKVPLPASGTHSSNVVPSAEWECKVWGVWLLCHCWIFSVFRSSLPRSVWLTKFNQFFLVKFLLISDEYVNLLTDRQTQTPWCNN